MKVNFIKHIHDGDLLSHIVLHGLTKALPRDKFTKFVEKKKENEEQCFDIRILVDDIEIDLEDFVKHWQDQVSKMIRKKAKELMADKCGAIEDLLCDLEERLQEEVKKRLEDWERELDKN